jgi:hypothetical protein
MGTDTLKLQESMTEADDVIVVLINGGEIQVHSSVDSKGEFFEILDIVAEMGDEYYPDESVDNLH